LLFITALIGLIFIPNILTIIFSPITNSSTRECFAFIGLFYFNLIRILGENTVTNMFILSYPGLTYLHVIALLAGVSMLVIKYISIQNRTPPLWILALKE